MIRVLKESETKNRHTVGPIASVEHVDHALRTWGFYVDPAHDPLRIDRDEMSEAEAWGCVSYKGHGLRVRLLNTPETGFRLDIAEESTFDRWSNSRNFTILEPDHYNLGGLTKMMLEIMAAINGELFNFDEDFRTFEVSC